MIKASCHCGAVKLSIQKLPDTYTECNCSICKRYAAQWLYLTAAEVDIDAAEGSIERYQWGDHEIDFCHCRVCGCVTHYMIPQEKTGRVAVNARVLESEVLHELKKREFDGAAM